MVKHLLRSIPNWPAAARPLLEFGVAKTSNNSTAPNRLVSRDLAQRKKPPIGLDKHLSDAADSASQRANTFAAKQLRTQKTAPANCCRPEGCVEKKSKKG
jgi:hypothetical protein